MRKTLNYLLPLFLIILGYLVYMQWFSPSKPLLYLTPEKTTFPSHLSSLPIKLVNGPVDTLNIQDNTFTVFVVDFVSRSTNTDFSDSFYAKLKRFHELVAKKGVNIVYLWSTNKQEDAVKLAMSLELDAYAKHVVFNQRLKAQYQQIGLQIRIYPLVFVYSQQGEMIFQQQILPNTLEDLMSVLDRGK